MTQVRKYALVLEFPHNYIFSSDTLLVCDSEKVHSALVFNCANGNRLPSPLFAYHIYFVMFCRFKESLNYSCGLELCNS